MNAVLKEPGFKLNRKQLQAQAMLSAEATHCMLYGGSRSGKTFLLVRNIVMRALKAPKSKHLILRFRFNQCKTHVAMGTFPDVMAKAFPDIAYDISRTDWYATLENGSEIWFGGLDDKERTEKILGAEYATVYFNECSQISFASREMAITRLAQLVMQEIDGKDPQPLKLRAYYDANPPTKAHWTYKLFKQKLNPDTKENVSNPAAYASFQINPQDNRSNLSPEYMATIEGLSTRMKRRFLEGEFADATPNALFDEAIIDKWRVMDGAIPDMVRLVVAIDPSGSGDEDNADNDEIGIAVAGIGTDGNGYVLEDCSVKAGPATWGGLGVNAYVRHKADALVGEINYGGDMVRATVMTAAAKEGVRVNFKKVTATRGKVVRAEPFSALYEQGKIRHVGIFAKMEDELCAMSTFGYTGEGSPNRADAVIWALTELFPAMLAGKRTDKPPRQSPGRSYGGWQS